MSPAWRRALQDAFDGDPLPARACALRKGLTWERAPPAGGRAVAGGAAADAGRLIKLE